MTHHNYKPRRAGARWLEGAPAYILDVWDNGGRTADRFTVYVFGEGHGRPGKGPGDTRIDYFGASETPSSAQGVGMWGECYAYERADFIYRRPDGNRRIRWLDLPVAVRSSVIAACEREDDTLEPVAVGSLRCGDLLDLQRDPFADPKGRNRMFSFELARVIGFERETPECTRVDTDSGSFGFPPLHVIKVRRPMESTK